MTTSLLGRRARGASPDLQLIADSISHLMWTCGPDGVATYVNERVAEFTGQASGSPSGWDFNVIAHPDDCDRAVREWVHAVRTQTQFALDVRIKRFDGRFVWHAFRADPIRDAQGQVVAWLGTATDIGAAKHLEEQLRASQRKTAQTLALLETLQSHAPVGLGFIDRDYRRVRVNEQLAEFTSSTVAEQVGALVPDLVPAFWPQLEPLYACVLETGQPVLDVEVAGPSGPDPLQTRHWLNSYYPVALADEVIGVGIVAIEITDRKRAEQANRQLAAIVEQSHDAIVGSTTDGIATSWNHAAELLLGYTAHEIVGQPLAVLAPTELVDEQERMRARILAGGPAERYETTRQCKDGSLVDVLITSSPAIDEAGNVVGVSVIILDITERVQARKAALNSQRQLAEAQHLAQVGSFEKDLTTGVMTWSTELYRLLGLDPNVTPTLELFLSRVHPDDRQRFAQAHAGVLRDPAPVDVAHRIVHDNGDLRWVESRAVCEFDDDGHPIKMRGALRDTTEQTEAVRIKHQAEARFEVGFEQAGVGTAILDLDGVVTRVNHAACVMLNRAGHELIGANWIAFSHPDDLPLGVALAAAHTVGNDTYADERRFLRPDGTAVWTSLNLTLVRDELGGPIYYLAQVQDIDTRKDLEEQLVHQALHDPLTGLANRALLKDRMSRLLAGTRRRRTQLGVIFCDLDSFKLINDSFSHDAGDEALRQAAHVITTAIGPSNTAARFGGDEFVILCEDTTGHDTLDIAEAARGAVVNHRYRIGDQEVHLTASFGVALSDKSATPESLLRDSDAAMFRAKELGRDRVEVSDAALRHHAQRELTIATALRDALGRDELSVHYQPVFDLATGKLVSAEALLRWHHPDLGSISPERFIPLAEQTGLIIPIGAWVLQQACRQLAQWQQTNPTMTLAVNLSVRQMLTPGIIEDITQVVRSTGVPANTLCLELTESAFMQDADYFAATLAELKGLGVQLSIDDFGTGYSSLSYLKNFPVDAVKIDRAFVEGLGTDQRDYSLVAAILAMAQALNLTVTAEGIETKEQLAILTTLGCQRGQGYLLGRPDIEPAMQRLLRQSAAGDSSTPNIGRPAAVVMPIASVNDSKPTRPFRSTVATTSGQGLRA
jgi:diguanylate cyclase (GGDEF)-like protein/PAS domain S-box-containing protein